MLHNITSDAWQIVVATTKPEIVASEEGESVAGNATPVANPFTEGLLRSIISLTSDQQLELVKELAKGPEKGLTKDQFRKRAERRAGELLREIPKLHGARPASHDASPLKEVGITWSQSSRWQAEAGSC